jgi:hypothetical protein
MAVLPQPLAPIAGLIEPQALDHGAHRAIEEHDALIEQTLQPLDARAPLGFIARLDGEGCRARPARALAGAPLAFAVGAWGGSGGGTRGHGVVGTGPGVPGKLRVLPIGRRSAGAVGAISWGGFHVSAPTAAVGECGSGRSPSAWQMA